MPNVLVQTEPEQYLFEKSVFQENYDGTLSVRYTGEHNTHTVFAAGEWKAVSVYETEIQNDVPGEDLFDEIALFMQAGNQTVPSRPELLVADDVSLYISRVREEVEETVDAFYLDTTAEVVDGFLDTAYVAITGAIRVAGVKKARECWEAILRANTSKIDGTYGETVTDPVTGKILKPEGWKAPDIKGILGRD